jgi:hypothetical protein
MQECGTPSGSESCSSRVCDRLVVQVQADPSREKFEKTVAWGAISYQPRVLGPRSLHSLDRARGRGSRISRHRARCGLSTRLKSGIASGC